jgi:hypothetical protein
MTVQPQIRYRAPTSSTVDRKLAAKTARVSGLTHEGTPTITRRRQTAHFVLHFVEMCAPMYIGFAVGDLVYFWAAEHQGYSAPFRQLPELSVLVVTFTMTAPMTAWMFFRGMRGGPPWRCLLRCPFWQSCCLLSGGSRSSQWVISPSWSTA